MEAQQPIANLQDVSHDLLLMQRIQNVAEDAADSAASSAAVYARQEREWSAFKTSKAQVDLIAKRAMVRQDIPVGSFSYAEPLLEKDRLKIYYKVGSEECFVEVRVLDPEEVQQLETYRICDAVFHEHRRASVQQNCCCCTIL